MALKDKLRELLDIKGIKPADLARESGVSEAMLSYYLNGKREPMGKTCFKLASALGVSVDELLETPFAGMKKEAPTVEETAEAIRVLLTARLGHEPSRKELKLFESIFDGIAEYLDSSDE